MCHQQIKYTPVFKLCTESWKAISTQPDGTGDPIILAIISVYNMSYLSACSLVCCGWLTQPRNKHKGARHISFTGIQPTIGLPSVRIWHPISTYACLPACPTVSVSVHLHPCFPLQWRWMLNPVNESTDEGNELDCLSSVISQPHRTSIHRDPNEWARHSGIPIGTRLSKNWVNQWINKFLLV